MPLPTWITPPLTPGLYQSKLPDPGAVLGVKELPLSGVPQDWAQAAVESATLLSGYFLQGTALKAGWPNSLGDLDALLNTAVVVAGAQKGEDPLRIINAVINLVQHSKLLLAILEQPLQEVQKLLVEALAGVINVTVTSAAQIVPIVGWVVTIVKSTVQISRIIKENNERGFGILPGTLQGLLQGVVPSFNADRDNDATNALLKVLDGDDWTEIWMPSVTSWSMLALDKSGDGKIDGWFIGAGISGGLATDIEMPGGVWGVIPGMSQIGSAYYGFTGAAAPGGVRSISDAYPSVNQLAGLAWARLQTLSGQCCNIRLKKILYAWRIWQGEARKFSEILADQGGDLAPAIRLARHIVDAARGTPYQDGKRFYQAGLYPGVQRQWTYISERVEKALKEMRERIWMLLGTIACAYVPPDAPALQDDSELRVRYAAMRMKLLKHPARWDVERDLVPDAPYRQMLFDATIGSKFAAPDALRRHRTLDGGPEPSPPKLPGALYGGGEEEGGGSGWIAAVVVAALAIFVFSRWGKGR